MRRLVTYVPGISEMEETQDGTEVISDKVKAEKFSELDKRNTNLKDSINSAIKIHTKKYI